MSSDSRACQFRRSWSIPAWHANRTPRFLILMETNLWLEPTPNANALEISESERRPPENCDDPDLSQMPTFWVV